RSGGSMAAPLQFGAGTPGKKRAPHKPKAPAAPASLNIGLMDLTLTTCRWPTGQVGGEHRFCGHPAPADPGKPYCEAHTAAAEGPGTRSERAAADLVNAA